MVETSEPRHADCDHTIWDVLALLVPMSTQPGCLPSPMASELGMGKTQAIGLRPGPAAEQGTNFHEPLNFPEPYLKRQNGDPRLIGLP